MIALLLLGCVGPAEQGPTSGTLRVLTYNVHGLPDGITGDDGTARMDGIAPLLGGFDLVGLQETFVDEFRDTLLGGDEHPTQVAFDTPLDDTRAYGSGLAVLGAWPMVDSQTWYYDECNGLLDDGSDCFASKGLLALRFELGGVTVDLYDTHLDAGGSAEDDVVRAAQVEEVIDHIDEYSGDGALIFVGDTNLEGDDPDDVPIMARLIDGAGLTDTCEAVGCDSPGRIDRLMFRGGGGLDLQPEDWAIEDAFVDAAGEPLSDHLALSAGLSWDAR